MHEINCASAKPSQISSIRELLRILALLLFDNKAPQNQSGTNGIIQRQAKKNCCLN